MHPTQNKTPIDSRSAEHEAEDREAALDTMTREARENDSNTTREDIERLVNDALEHDPHGEFAQHFLEVLQAERELAEPFNRPAGWQADQAGAYQEIKVDLAGLRNFEFDEPDACHAIEPDDAPDLDEASPDLDDGGPSYG